MVDGGNDGLSVRDQSGHNERGASAKIGGFDLRARKCGDTMNYRVVALDNDIGTHAVQLASQHEAVLEHILGDHAGALAQSEEAHGLSLHIGGKSRERKRLDVRRQNRPFSPAGAFARTALDTDTHLLVLL